MPVFVSVHWTTKLMPDCKPGAGVVARPETARETALKTPKSSAVNVPPLEVVTVNPPELGAVWTYPGWRTSAMLYVPGPTPVNE